MKFFIVTIEFFFLILYYLIRGKTNFYINKNVSHALIITNGEINFMVILIEL